MTIDELVLQVVNGVNESWPTLYKIRYVYLSLGKMLQKHTDFFFSVENKLDEANLTLEQIKEIYYDDKNTGDLRIICRSASLILQRCYDMLGIKSELVKTNNTIVAKQDEQEFLIHHWFLAVEDAGKTYFLTLSADLPYIQMGMETRHFASTIPYKRVMGDREVQVYQGEERKCSSIGKDRLREMDYEIGYVKNLYPLDERYRSSRTVHYNYDDAAIQMLNSDLVSNKLYTEMEEQSTRFYTKLMEFKYGDREVSFYNSHVNSITKEDWEAWTRKLCKYVHRKLEQIIGYRIIVTKYYNEPDWNYKEWIYEICAQLQRYLFSYMDTDHPELYVQGDFNYTKWSKGMRKAIENNYDEYDIDNVLMILDKTNLLASSAILGKPVKNFMKIFNMLSYHFISRSFVLESKTNNGVATSKYISHKFNRLFRKIFSCGEGITDFNRMEYSEQIVIIKMIVDKMFPELNMENAILEEYYDERYSIVQNRIQSYAIKHRENGNYAIVFNILGDDTYGDTYYLFDPKENIFRTVNILTINSEYIIVSDRLRTKIEDMEDIDQKKNKR